MILPGKNEVIDSVGVIVGIIIFEICRINIVVTIRFRAVVGLIAALNLYIL